MIRLPKCRKCSAGLQLIPNMDAGMFTRMVWACSDIACPLVDKKVETPQWVQIEDRVEKAQQASEICKEQVPDRMLFGAFLHCGRPMPCKVHRKG